MNLRRTHESPLVFDIILVCVAIFGFVIAQKSFLAAGWWNIVGICAIIGECILLYGSCIEPRCIVVKKYREALIPHPAEWVRILFFSDFHAGGYKSAAWYARVVEKAKTLDADIIIMGGDYVVDISTPIKDLGAFATLKGKIGKYYVMGNHDLVDHPAEIRDALETWGYIWIEKKILRLEKQGRSFDLAGISDPWFDDARIPKRQDADMPHITISHEPDVLMDYVGGETDLMLCGHTHGGQIRFPIIGPMVIPTRIGRGLDRGRKVFHKITCIISPGLGESDIRACLLNPPSIVCVDIGV